MTDPFIRALTFADLDGALRLSTAVGWNQRLDDWRMLLRIAPLGAFAALIEDCVIGTAIAIDYGSFAWIAMMLVDPAYRGRGVGRRLLEAAMAAVSSSHRIRLDATPLGRPLYHRYGFEVEATLSRHVRDGSMRSGPTMWDGLNAPFGVRPPTASDLSIIIERDREIFGGSRGAVLEWAFDTAPQYAYVAGTDNGLIHYCLGRPGRLFDQIGPVVAGHDDIAGALLNAALAAAGSHPVAVDAFDAQPAFSARLQSRGFIAQRPLIRMCRPAPSAAGERSSERRTPVCGTADMPQPQGREFAILGPEFA